METLLENVNEYLLLGLTILGAISALAHGLEPLVKLTKTEKDDKILAKINEVLSSVQNLLSKLAAPKKS
jgi:predicted membrane GTPase involved in stress response